MEYISAEEFLKQNEKVQRTLKEYFDQELILYSFNNSVNYGVFYDVIDEIPLLTEGDIRKFIEDRTGCKVTLVQSNSLPVEIWLSSVDVNIKRISSIDKFDVLQAYWKVAIEIIKEELR